MEAEIITIGDELLIGQTVDTNSAYLGQKLGSIGISVSRKTAISDNESAILQAIEESITSQNSVVINVEGEEDLDIKIDKFKIKRDK